MNGYLNFPADSQIFSADSGSWHEPDESKTQTQEILFYFLLDLKVFRLPGKGHVPHVWLKGLWGFSIKKEG